MEVFKGSLVYQDSRFNKLLLDIGFYDTPMKVSLKLQMLNGAGFVRRYQCNNTNTCDNHSWLDLKTVCRTHSTLAHLFIFCHDFKGNK